VPARPVQGDRKVQQDPLQVVPRVRQVLVVRRAMSSTRRLSTTN